MTPEHLLCTPLLMASPVPLHPLQLAPASPRAAYGGQELLGGLGRGVGGEEEREEGGAANLSEPLRKTTFKERDARE